MVKSQEDKNRTRIERFIEDIGLEQMIAMTDAELVKMPNFGKTAIKMFRSMYPRRPTGYYGQIHIHASHEFTQ